MITQTVTLHTYYQILTVMETLVTEVFDDVVVKFISCVDLYNLAQTCERFQKQIKMIHMKKSVHYEVQRRMRHICGNKWNTISKVMKKSGAIISGSFVLQCIMGEQWNGSDIDIYVKCDVFDAFEKIRHKIDLNATDPSMSTPPFSKNTSIRHIDSDASSEAMSSDEEPVQINHSFTSNDEESVRNNSSFVSSENIYATDVDEFYSGEICDSYEEDCTVDETTYFMEEYAKHYASIPDNILLFMSTICKNIRHPGYYDGLKIVNFELNSNKMQFIATSHVNETIADYDFNICRNMYKWGKIFKAKNIYIHAMNEIFTKCTNFPPKSRDGQINIERYCKYADRGFDFYMDDFKKYVTREDVMRIFNITFIELTPHIESHATITNDDKYKYMCKDGFVGYYTYTRKAGINYDVRTGVRRIFKINDESLRLGLIIRCSKERNACVFRTLYPNIVHLHVPQYRNSVSNKDCSFVNDDCSVSTKLFVLDEQNVIFK